ncbi:hypothetical protein CRYUN_Cryun12cG0007300 [Craigia yunnanensis]
MTPSTEPLALEKRMSNQAFKIKKKDKKKNKLAKLEDQSEENVKQKYQETEEIELKESKEGKKKRKKEKESSKEGESKEGNREESADEPKKKKDKKQKEEEENEEFNETRKGKQNSIQFDGKEKVVVSGRNAEEAKYAPLKSFSDSKLPENVLDCCKDFSSPSYIQAHAWPFLLHGRDFIGIAKTGSGKTLAFGVPAMMHVLSKRKGKSSNGKNPLCLVLSPTRELAEQVLRCDSPKVYFLHHDSKRNQRRRSAGLIIGIHEKRREEPKTMVRLIGLNCLVSHPVVKTVQCHTSNQYYRGRQCLKRGELLWVKNTYLTSKR